MAAMFFSIIIRLSGQFRIRSTKVLAVKYKK
jgi:hypothetical protein